MKSIKNLGIIHDNDYAKYPEGAIKNETDTEQGTPVIGEIYNGIIANIYAILKDRGITLSDVEDNELNGYQLLNALKLNTNVLNDVQQVLTKGVGNVWSLPIKFSILPQNYIVIARVTEDFNELELHTIKGTEAAEYPFSPQSFSTGNYLMLVINSSETTAINLSQISGAGTTNQGDEIFTIYGTPLSYTEKDIYYFDDGKITDEKPKTYNIEQMVIDNNVDEVLVDVIHQQNSFILMCYNTSSGDYIFYIIRDSDMETLIPVNLTFDFNIGVDNSPIMLADEQYLYFSNKGNYSSNDYEFIKVSFDGLDEFTLIDIITIDSSFEKTSNIVFKNNGFFTLIDSTIKYFHISGASPILIGDYAFLNGHLFNIKGTLYYTNGEVGKKINLEI